MYTLEDYEKAKSARAEWNDRWNNYMGNNPDKYQSDLKAAAKKVREIEQYLKDAGLLPLSEKEKVERDLDRAFPNAQSKEIVVHNGMKYQRRFLPLDKSRSGKTVKEWAKSWEPVGE